jgi:branched-chain amino acid transport system substrate-binding protein
MRLAALVDVIRADQGVDKLYLIGQDYSFGQHVLRQGRAMLATARPDLQIVGEDLHPIARVKDFLPYATKIKASGAQAVLTGNWGNDLTLLVRALRDVGAQVRLYTFYGNALGAPAAIGEAGVGAVHAVAEWHPNAGGAASDAFHARFRQRFPDPKDDYVHVRMQVMVEMLAAAIERAGSTDAVAVARALEGARFDARTLGGLHEAVMRADDHQLQQPLYVSVMDRFGTQGVRTEVEGSGFGFRTLRRLSTEQVTQSHTCRMTRP